MNIDTHGTAKLFHPRGPLVKLPVPSDPKEAFEHISKCLDAGWLVAAPGLEMGEQKEEVGYIVRGECDGNGEVTPFLLLYSSNEGMSFSFLKVYLNTTEDTAAFEFAAKMRLKDFPVYAGNDKPERGKSAKLDSYIVKVKKPFGVILKGNPKYNEIDRAAHLTKNEIYKVPRRLFVRWVDQAPPASAKNEAPPTPPAKPAAPPAKPVAAPSTNHATRKPIQGKESTVEEKHAGALRGYRNAK